VATEAEMMGRHVTVDREVTGFWGLFSFGPDTWCKNCGQVVHDEYIDSFDGECPAAGKAHKPAVGKFWRI
jgi:hypothetical protein